MQQFIEYIIKNLVDKPEAVEVICRENGENNLIAEVRVDQDDVAKVVGRKGRTINAVRTLAMMAAARLGWRIRIELIESPAPTV